MDNFEKTKRAMAEAISNPKTETPESASKDSQIKSLFELTEQEKTDLRKRIDVSQGMVRIFIHPFYVSYHFPHWQKALSGDDLPEDDGYHHEMSIKYSRHKDIEAALIRFLSLDPSRTPPVFIFEEQENIAKTAAKISAAVPNLANTAYIVPTHQRTSEPSFEKEPLSIKQRADKLGSPKNIRKEVDEDWQKFKTILAGLGIKKSLIGGVALELYKPEDLKLETYHQQRLAAGAKNVKYDLEWCVGDAMKRLSEDGGISIEASTLSAPHSRKEILDIENEK